MRHREGVPYWQDGLPQARVLPSLSHPRERLRHLQGGELQPLGCLQGGGLAGAEGEPARLQVLEGAARTQVRRGVV